MPVCKVGTAYIAGEKNSDCKWCMDLGDTSFCVLSIPSRAMREKNFAFWMSACKLAIFLKHLPDITGKVLEVGCGLWYTPKQCLSRDGVEWTGLDPRWGGHDVPERSIVGGRAGKLPFPDEEFDWVLSFSAIEHFKDNTRDVISETARVLKPGGKALIDASMGGGKTRKPFGGLDSRPFLKMFKSDVWKDVITKKWKQDDPLIKIAYYEGYELEVLAEKL